MITLKMGRIKKEHTRVLVEKYGVYASKYVGLDAAILMHPKTWKASGHVDAFSDPLIDNKDSKKRYRADVLIEDHAEKLENKAQKRNHQSQKTFWRCF